MTSGPTFLMKAVVRAGDVQVAVWQGLVTSRVMVNCFVWPARVAVIKIVNVFPI